LTIQSIRGWQDVQEEVLKRIHARTWKPGDLIPNEADLALEFGCARATVNRALRALAETGMLDRRRKAGTRVALQPVAKATLSIPVIRKEIEATGQKYGYSLLQREVDKPDPAIRASMGTGASDRLLHLTALHTGDDRPYAIEDRWINPAVVPAADTESFETISANEWLLTHIPYTNGEISFSATKAGSSEANALKCPIGSALFVVDRLTFDQERAITKLRLVYAPGHQLRTEL
jgi:GntR family histidine utilization transcriptional repressor